MVNRFFFCINIGGAVIIHIAQTKKIQQEEPCEEIIKGNIMEEDADMW